MILTYKVKHSFDFTNELKKAEQIAKFAVKTRTLKSSDVKHFGLKSILSNQILRRYSRNKKCKNIHSIKLIYPKQGISFNKNKVWLSALKIEFTFNKVVDLINKIEIDNNYFYVACTVKEEQIFEPKGFIGIDRNAAGHVAVCSSDHNIIKLGKKSNHIKSKYKSIRKYLKKKKKYNKLKTIGHREQNIIRDISHKISRKIVDLAKEKSYAIVLEDLKNIRKQRRGKKINFIKNNWNFYQLQTFIEYKSKLLGVSVFYVDPYNTSKTCSQCGLIGIREKKIFKCPHCEHVDHADANASFNIAKAGKLLYDRLHTDRDVCKGTIDSPKRIGLERSQP